MKGFRFKLALAGALGAFAFIAGSGLTISSGWLITMASKQPPILTLSVSIVAVRFFGISRSVSRYLERIVSHEAVFRRLTSIRVALFEKFTNRPLGLAKDINSGSLVKTMVDDVERAQEFQLRILLPGFAAVIALTAGVLVGALIRPETVLVTAPTSFVLLILLPFLISKTCTSSAKALELLEDDYAAVLTSTTHGIVEAKMYGYLEKSLESAHSVENEMHKEEKNLYLRIWFWGALTSATIGLAIVGATLLARYLTAANSIPAVQITMIIFLPLVIFEAITVWFPNLFSSGKLKLAQEKIQDFLSEDFPSNFRNIARANSPSLRLQNAGASWDTPFMKPVSFELTKGQHVVIRGRSGSGKSTLAMAILGLLPHQGEISITGSISGVLQRGHVFNTSLRENLLIANPELNDQQLLHSLEIVELSHLDLDALLGEFGRPLSGGESKRLGLARALLSDADILVLDEPTEHLDQDLAKRIEARVLSDCKEKILVIITHSGWGNVSRNITVERE